MKALESIWGDIGLMRHLAKNHAPEWRHGMVKKIGFLLIFATLIFHSGGVLSAQEIDPATGSPPTELSPTVLEPITPSVGGNILWDTFHGIHLDYSPSGRYSQLTALLMEQGYTVDENNSGVLTLDLSIYDIIVVSVVSASNSAYSPTEVTAIQNFVNGGGGLLIMGDNANPVIPHGNVNPVAQTFGTTLGLANFPSNDVYITNFTSHSIFAGVSEFYMRAAGEISGNTPSSEEAWADTGQATVTVAEPESGRVVALGDTNTLDNVYISNVDNQLFGENIFAWLGDGGTPQPCTLDINLSYVDGTLTKDFHVGTLKPATLRHWLIFRRQLIHRWTASLPVVDPPISFSVVIPGYPPVGRIGFLTLITNPKGMVCLDFAMIDTGTPSTNVSVEELTDLLQEAGQVVPEGLR